MSLSSNTRTRSKRSSGSSSTSTSSTSTTTTTTTTTTASPFTEFPFSDIGGPWERTLNGLNGDGGGVFGGDIDFDPLAFSDAANADGLFARNVDLDELDAVEVFSMPDLFDFDDPMIVDEEAKKMEVKELPARYYSDMPPLHSSTTPTSNSHLAASPTTPTSTSPSMSATTPPPSYSCSSSDLTMGEKENQYQHWDGKASLKRGNSLLISIPCSALPPPSPAPSAAATQSFSQKRERVTIKSEMPIFERMQRQHQNQPLHHTPSGPSGENEVEDKAQKASIRPFPKSLPAPSSVTDIKKFLKELAALDSSQFSLFMDQIRKGRSLTATEKTNERKIRRRINNRESARRSRADKKEHTNSLQHQIDLLTTQLHETKLEVTSLSSDNSQMRSEIGFTYSLIQSNPVLLQLFTDVREKHEASRLNGAAGGQGAEKRRKLQ